MTSVSRGYRAAQRYSPRRGRRRSRGCRSGASFAAQLSVGCAHRKAGSHHSGAAGDEHERARHRQRLLRVNVAIPTMEKDFDTNVNTIQWVVNAYALTFG
jgi:hypothetical protein